MKRSKWMTLLSILLILCMAVQPVSAAGRRNNNSRNNKQSYSAEVRRGNNKKNVQKETEETETVTEEESTVSTEAVAVMSLVEDQTTVENGEMLRASTYSLMTADETSGTTDEGTAQAAGTVLKYFPVTMYDYDTATINAATDALDNDLTVREGLYFSGGSPAYTKGASTGFVVGQYCIQNVRASKNDVGSWLYVADDGQIYSDTDKTHATVWTLKYENAQYYLMNGEMYLYVGTGRYDEKLVPDTTPITITEFASSEYSGVTNAVQLSQNGKYLVQYGGSNVTEYGAHGGNNDTGNAMWFYAVDSDGNISETASEPIVGEEQIVSGYEEWNRWDKASGNNANGDLFYTGLVQNTFVDDQIVFNVNEGGIFTYNSTEVVGTDGSVSTDNPGAKKVYEYIGLPFVLTKEGVYSFDSDINGSYFEDADEDGNADLKSGTKDNPYNLKFAENTPQPKPTDLSVGDGSVNAWFPFNAEESYTTSQVNYHFGMRADLPFSMTSNGRIKSTDETSTPITFTFSGDDDVWVFIDGHLVIDLGGIHNRLDVTIDFAANTVTYSEKNAQDTNTTTGSYNDADFASEQKLFTDSKGTGLINKTRDAFAAETNHEMSVFYLERGEGTSNCRIEFNLPMNDTVLVTKDATKSWSQEAEKADLEKNPNMEDPGVDELTAAEQAIVNNIDFGFTLYKKNESGDFEPVANTNYYLVGRDVEGTVIGNTDGNGHFYLRNGQSAKFITDIPAEGATYYVVEDTVPEGFITPDFNFAGEAASGFSYVDGDGNTQNVTEGNQIPEQIIPAGGTIPNKSYEVTVKGSVEANDSVEFICSNFLDAKLPNPSALAIEDIIVIDYGLPVQIDPLVNDMFRGDTQEIVYVNGANVTLTEKVSDGIVTGTWTEGAKPKFGTIALKKVDDAVAEDGAVTRDTLVYTLKEQLTEVEELTYIVKVTGKEVQDVTDEVLEQYDYAIGKIYIVPATTMYYEENFSNLVTFTGGGWEGVVETEGTSEYQEPGVAGTPNDSTYGSDVAYLSDSKDSNGTSYYGDTTNGAIRFSYTFTGTGTSFFARTSAATGYMQVKLYEGKDTTKCINTTYRDTYYEDKNDTSEDSAGILYNVPVYTESDLHYGTYTVVATIAKAGTAAAGGENGSGNEFYLDGIRIMKPLNENITYDPETGEKIIPEITEKALGAYATDGEANMAVLTLRQKLITDAEEGITPWNFVVLTDTNGKITTAEEYVSIGPKEEVYLMPGQSISFALKHWETDGFKLYMGMKAPFGSGKVQVGQTTYELANAADCYYDITTNYSGLVTEYEQVTEGTTEPYYVATFTLTATDRIVSLTNIKVTGNYEFEIVENVNIDIEGENGGEE